MEILKLVLRILRDALSLWAMCVIIFLAMAALTPMAAQNQAYKCGATTSQGKPCKMRVKTLGSKCHHHAENGTANATVGRNAGSAVIHTCGAMTAKGTPCKRRVKIQGAKCYSHE